MNKVGLGWGTSWLGTVQYLLCTQSKLCSSHKHFIKGKSQVKFPSECCLTIQVNMYTWDFQVNHSILQVSSVQTILTRQSHSSHWSISGDDWNTLLFPTPWLERKSSYDSLVNWLTPVASLGWPSPHQAKGFT